MTPNTPTIMYYILPSLVIPVNSSSKVCSCCGYNNICIAPTAISMSSLGPEANSDCFILTVILTSPLAQAIGTPLSLLMKETSSVSDSTEENE